MVKFRLNPYSHVSTIFYFNESIVQTKYSTNYYFVESSKTFYLIESSPTCYFIDNILLQWKYNVIRICTSLKVVQHFTVF